MADADAMQVEIQVGDPAAKEPPSNPKAKMLAHAASMAAATAAAVASVRQAAKPATPEPSTIDEFFSGPAASASTCPSSQREPSSA